MPDVFTVASFMQLLQVFAPCFTAPSFSTFVTLMGGWSLATGRHTVTGVVRAANAVEWKHIRTFHRFFAEGAWLPDDIGLILVRLVVERCLTPGDTIIVPVDDTLGRHTGKKIAGASMHRDPLLSTGKRPFFHWGHLWVAASLPNQLPALNPTHSRYLHRTGLLGAWVFGDSQTSGLPRPFPSALRSIDNHAR
jgi:hypothetical protein